MTDVPEAGAAGRGGRSTRLTEILGAGWEERLAPGMEIEVVVYGKVLVGAAERFPASLLTAVGELASRARSLPGADRDSVEAMVRFPDGVRTVSV